MAEHPNVERARKGYEAFTAGDTDTVSSFFADDIVWHVPGNNLLTGAVRWASGAGSTSGTSDAAIVAADKMLGVPPMCDSTCTTPAEASS